MQILAFALGATQILAFLDTNMLVSPMQKLWRWGSKPTRGPRVNGFASQSNIGLSLYTNVVVETANHKNRNAPCCVLYFLSFYKNRNFPFIKSLVAMSNLRVEGPSTTGSAQYLPKLTYHWVPSHLPSHLHQSRQYHNVKLHSEITPVFDTLRRRVHQQTGSGSLGVDPTLLTQ